MKRLGLVLGIVLSILFLLYFFSTSSVEQGSFFEKDYYKNTLARLDSAKQHITFAKSLLDAGFAKMSITPLLNASEDNFLEGKFTQVPLSGFGARKGKPTTGIHDSIFVKAVALKTPGQTVYFVGADLLIMPPNIIDSVTVKLSKEGIRREQVYYSATHTHASLGAWGTGFIGELFAGKENPQVEKWLSQQIAKAILAARADLRPARWTSGSFDAASYIHNRLIGDIGTKNNDFSFIAFEQIGHKKGIIGSFAAHATTLGSENMEISADYPGYWENRMEATTVDYAVFFAGPVGSQSPVTVGEGFDKPKQLGEALADSLNKHLAHASFQDSLAFSTLTIKMQLPEYHIRLTPSINLTTFISNQLMPYPQHTYLQAVRLGNTVWISTPADFSGEYALTFKNALGMKGFSSNITSFNGSYVGYIVPGRYFYLDEYEPKTMGWFGPNMGEYTMELIRQMSRAITQTDNL